MVVVGADIHKRTHTFVAVNEVGRKLGEKVVAATTAGHAKALVWPAPSSAAMCCGVSRTPATCRRGWNVTCCRRGRRSCGWRQS